MAGQPFCRLTVLAPRQRVDVALPSDPAALARLDQAWTSEHLHHGGSDAPVHLGDDGGPDVAAGGTTGSIPPRV